MAEGLAADLPDDAFQKANAPEYLRGLFELVYDPRGSRRLRPLNEEPARIILTVQPLYVRAEDLTIAIQDLAGQAGPWLRSGVEVDKDRRIGPGWKKLAENDRGRGLEFSETVVVYELNLPSGLNRTSC